MSLLYTSKQYVGDNDHNNQNNSLHGLLLAHIGNDSKHAGNDTIDVALKGCFSNFDTVACVRNGSMAVLALVTCVLCALKVCRLHLSKHPTLHQYAIFYCALLECALCTVHWILGMYVQLDFVMQLLKLLQFLIVSHLYWTMANRSLHQEAMTRKVVTPVLVAALLYFSIVVILGSINVKNSWVECLQPYWLGLSATEFCLVQLFMVAGIYITRRLNEISTLDSVQRQQKCDLWILIVVFEASALAGSVYDLTMRIMGNEEDGCSGIFNHMQEIYSPVFGVFMVVKFLSPIWAMLLVFRPLEASPGDQEDLLPGVSEDGTYTSAFTPPYDRDRHRYKPLYSPGSGEPHLSDGDLTPTNSPSATTPVFGQIQHNQSNLATILED